ncbi:FAD-dependent oxidoreductase [Desulfofalx alkaliphila]|uniref:FAD-dependent oxidoreductase n=1 Tax=Desulfofalx alkaliphila TaxID=105483 RepID=UPI0004E1AA63|nr:FAD-dependent oxidoreductase [Desulfofalx alkaliphila]
MSKVNITIDGRQIVAEEGSNLLEVARQNGFDIPSLCHDPRLEPFGACRQCIVEIEGARGLVQACGAKVQQGMVVTTDSERIRAIRKLGLELLLTEHSGDCIAPCQLACPAEIDIQGFVAHIANGQTKEAARLIREKLPLPSAVGKVCPAFCEKECRRNLVDSPVAICSLKRFAGDYELNKDQYFVPEPKPDTGKRVAVVGGGPAGLSAAYYLALEGHRVSIFEAAPKLGGMMRYGIPEYRLSKELLDKEIQVITNLCENVFYNKELGRDFNLTQLKQWGFDAVFVGVGSWANQSLRLPGEELAGVYSGIGFLWEVANHNPLEIGDRVVVIGGGNTAMDAARTSVRLGAKEVTVVYRRSREEMPANPHEIEQADEEGVNFELLTAPLGFVGEEGRVTAIRCIKMQLGEPDSSGRRRPVPIEGSEFDIPVDTVITATGQRLKADCLDASTELTLTDRGNINVNDKTLQSHTPWVFAGGDCVTGPATVVQAVAAGRKAANSIHLYLSGRPVAAPEKPFNCTRGRLDELDPAEFADREKIVRTPMPTVEPEIRKDSFKEFELGFTEELALREAERCLSCGCLDVFTCKLREYATALKVQADILGFGKKEYPVFADHPNIIRDPNKCVLCGNCVRICQEVEGAGVLGFINRGSETVVMPSMGVRLSDTNCRRCGQCVNICPTGALSYNTSLPKPGPWRTEKVQSVCPHCSIGCNLELNVVGDQIINVTAAIDSDTVNEGSLCQKGTFGCVSAGEKAERLFTPWVASEGLLKENNWQQAIDAAGQIIKDIRSGGMDKMAVVISPNLTNEENYLAYKLGRMVLGTDKIYSSAAVPTLDYRGQKPTFRDLMNSDLIVLFDEDSLNKYPIARQKIKKAVSRGSKLVIVSPRVTELDSIASLALKVRGDKRALLLKSFVKYVLQYNLVVDKAYTEFGQLINELENELSEDFYDLVQHFRIKADKIIEAIHLYIRAKNAVLVVDGQGAGPDLLKMMEALALITGNLGRQERGIISLYPHANIQGQLDLGIKVTVHDYKDLINGLKAGDFKGLLVVDDGSGIDSQLLQQGVKTIVITPLMQQGLYADVILPGSAFGETGGTYTNCEGKIQPVQRALSPVAGLETWQILLELAKNLGYEMNYQQGSDIYREMIKRLI